MAMGASIAAAASIACPIPVFPVVLAALKAIYDAVQASAEASEEAARMVVYCAAMTASLSKFAGTPRPRIPGAAAAEPRPHRRQGQARRRHGRAPEQRGGGPPGAPRAAGEAARALRPPPDRHRQLVQGSLGQGRAAGRQGHQGGHGPGAAAEHGRRRRHKGQRGRAAQQEVRRPRVEPAAPEKAVPCTGQLTALDQLREPAGLASGPGSVRNPSRRSEPSDRRWKPPPLGAAVEDGSGDVAGAGLEAVGLES